MTTQTSQSQVISQMRSSRLMKEWIEVRKCPVENINISPLHEDNLNEW